MYAKLFSRIAQSSLMEEDVETRYCFMMLLAIADSTGDVIGTDVALARSINLPLDMFKRCIESLMAPDPDSNSQVQEGRRLVPSDSGRGYFIVNYATYRKIKTAEEKKAYMREYMQRYRKGKEGNDVTDVKNCKTKLSELIHAEGEGEGDTEAEAEAEADKGETPLTPLGGEAPEKPRREQSRLPETAEAKAIADMFNRRHSTAWSKAEIRAFKDGVKNGIISAETLAIIVPYYRQERAKGENGRHRRDLGTFLNNFTGELDRAKASQQPTAPAPPKPDPAGWAEWITAHSGKYKPFAHSFALERAEFAGAARQPEGRP